MVFKYILLCLLIFIFAKFASKIKNELALRAEDQKRMSKPDDELIGEYFYMKKSGKDDADLNLYMIEATQNLPHIINIHGGAFIASDADTLDTQSDRISKNFNSHVVSRFCLRLFISFDLQLVNNNK